MQRNHERLHRDEKDLRSLARAELQAIYTDLGGIKTHCKEGRCRPRKAAYQLAVKRILHVERLRGNV